jgi:hypothetical protein
MAIWSRKAKKVKEVQRFDGPGAKGGDKTAYFNLYIHDDDSVRTIEFDRTGAHVAEYDGDPVFPDDKKPEPLAEGVPPTSRPVAAAPKAK